MSDILERLNDLWEKVSDVDSVTVLDAQSEIKKLRAAIKMALDCIEDVDAIGASQTLAKALGEKE